jgi:hypothetical protein
LQALNELFGVGEFVMNRVGLDDPQRGRNAKLSPRYRNMLIGTLRKAYGSFAPHCADGERLCDVLHKLDIASLSQLIRDYEAKKLQQICQR